MALSIAKGRKCFSAISTQCLGTSGPSPFPQGPSPSRLFCTAPPNTPNIGAPQYVRQMLTSMKGEINDNTIIVGDFNTPLTPMDRSTKQKINKETQTVDITIDQLDLIDIYRTFHPKTMNFTFFSSTRGTFSRIDHILGYKSSLGKFKKIEIIPNIFSDHNVVGLDVNYRKKTIKNSNTFPFKVGQGPTL